MQWLTVTPPSGRTASEAVRVRERVRERDRERARERREREREKREERERNSTRVDAVFEAIPTVPIVGEAAERAHRFHLALAPDTHTHAVCKRVSE